MLYKEIFASKSETVVYTALVKTVVDSYCFDTLIKLIQKLVDQINESIGAK